MLTRLGSIQRSRPSRFDREAALKQVTELFWHKGFDGTSLDDISGVTGVHRPTLYRFLGPKEDIYSAALEACLSLVQTRIEASLQAPGPLESTLLKMFREEFAHCAEKRRGCFAVVTAIPIVARFQRVEILLREHAARRRTLVARRLIVAAQSNELRQKIEVAAKAYLAAMLLDGLGALSRVDPRESEVLPVKKWTANAICSGR